VAVQLLKVGKNDDKEAVVMHPAHTGFPLGRQLLTNIEEVRINQVTKVNASTIVLHS